MAGVYSTAAGKSAATEPFIGLNLDELRVQDRAAFERGFDLGFYFRGCYFRLDVDFVGNPFHSL
jgi:hypothetical protein